MLWKTERYDRALHYDVLAAWWRDHGWGRVPPEILPRGVVVFCDDHLVAGGFVHCSIDVPVAVLAWPTVQPRHSLRWKALCHLVRAMKGLALEHVGDAGFIYGFTANRVVRWAYEIEGLRIAEPDSATMFFPVGNLDFTFITEDDHVPEQAGRRRPADRVRHRTVASALATALTAAGPEQRSG